MEILHRGPRYIARFLRCDDRPWACVSFEYWKPVPTLEGEFSGEGFFRHRRLNAIGVMAAENDWFQDDEILAVLAAIRGATAGYHLIGYGGSMGGFAAINFAGELGLAAVIAVIPQYSIDAAKAPYELRWREEASRLRFGHDRIESAAPVTKGWAIFDPWCVDGLHIRDIQRHHSLTEVRVPFGGHAVMGMLQQAGVYTDMFTDMLEERFDLAAWRRRWRGQRRTSAMFWLGFSAALLKRGNAAAALRAARLARRLPHPEPGWIDLAEAEALAALGDRSSATALAERWWDDPGIGWAAQERLDAWAEPAHAAPPMRRGLFERGLAKAGRLVRAALRVGG